MRPFYLFCIFFLNLILKILPFSILRVFILRISGANIGSSTFIARGVRVDFPWRLSLGNNCFISREVYFDCRGGEITVNDSSDISEGAVLYTLSHYVDCESFSPKKGNITIGSRVWICTRAILLPDSSVEDGVVLGAGSVAKGVLQKNSLYFGIPASHIRKLNPQRAYLVRR